MRRFLSTLENGVKAQDLRPENRECIKNLLSIGAANEHKNTFYLNNSFISGRLDVSSNGTGYLSAFSDKFKSDIIIENKNLNGAHLGDIVLAKLIGRSNKPRAKVIMVLKPAHATSLVYTKQVGAAILGVNFKTGLASALRASQKSLKALPLGTVLKINNATNEITEVVGNLNDPFCDDKISLALYNKNDEFGEACELQAAAYTSVDAASYPDRVDLSHLPFCTIDPVDAKDFDDAIYYDAKKHIIYVAIADVSAYVTPFSPIDKEAKERGFSIYFPHKAVPMLPRNLSENICSLVPDIPRLAFCFKIYLDDDLNVLKSELFEAIIVSKKRYNYDFIDGVLAGDNADELGFIRDLGEITQRLRDKRLKNAFSFRTNELRLELDERGLIKSTRFETDTHSHQLVEDCMLLANCEAAKRIKFGIFRNHLPPDLKKIHYLLDDLASLGLDFTYEPDLAKLIRKIQIAAEVLQNPDEIDKLIIKAQKKAGYEAISKGHFGLGFSTYSHFTSPIRRYSDLILHRILKANLNNDKKQLNYILDGIELVCERLSELEREADRVAFDFIDRKFARWASENIGKIVRCYVVSNGTELIARLDDELKGARIFVAGNFTCDLLTELLVKIQSAEIASGKIIAKVVKKLG
ncbi:ribonuclease R family protein [Campylobacter sp. 19-13652]|uniref:RNB domain-containing ribonuclease n=1 Tax=Campylobacter sp. 19-13652 TaxID=2840180 RepID=UPI001C787D27|nr:ribonuclease R family protein [Campylobacter sp. 19-13652]BCX79503.1 ribonuclease R [Campylobacter sp. 19-13652]